ncbi:hypothetical protein OG689_44540 [Kitasatospora sp. NBC_00240]|uniref:hypothetical protein n=1 Tax=Kitasatospora sp. NBC_00240 TaxID=2903567 RepID=UPI0022599030|nr:hypothetical protein [Kitasatospora sp. NBC_00240]MCX5216208.1 hypothetical protein [Kitasatospora sp. NBC_00240]
MNTWHQRFADLLAGNHTTTGDQVDAGAQLVVTSADGTEMFRQALARHHRADPDDAHLIWIRPLLGGFDAEDGYVFNLNLARRRALNWTDGRLEESGDVVLHLVSGEVARVQPAEDQELAELQRWDAFTDRFSAEEDAELGRLEADSWHGRFS